MEGRTDMMQQILALRNVAKALKTLRLLHIQFCTEKKIIFPHPSQTNTTVNVDFSLPIRGFIFPQKT
jgi:hypothetical protein